MLRHSNIIPNMAADMKGIVEEEFYSLNKKRLFTRLVLAGSMGCLGTYGLVSWHVLLMNREDCLEVVDRMGGKGWELWWK